jgi:hypothetical protein
VPKHAMKSNVPVVAAAVGKVVQITETAGVRNNVGFLLQLGKTVKAHLPCNATCCSSPASGSWEACLRLRYPKRDSTKIRLPCQR